MTVLAASEVPAYLLPADALVVAAAAVGYLCVRAGVVPVIRFLDDVSFDAA